MNKGKKVLAALLTAVCVAAGACGMAACNKDDEADGEIYAVYQTYVAYAESNGDEVLTYEEWLASVKGDTGAKGDKGDTGATGATGESGADGATWLTGDADPAEDSGKTGDLYLNTTSFDIFTKTAEGWSKIGNIKGADGAAGAAGEAGATGETGPQGETGAKGDKGDTGETGAAGTNGTNGADGVSVVSVEQIYADEWHINSYFEFTLSDDTVISTENTPITIVIPGKYYDAQDVEEVYTLKGYGVEEEYINYNGSGIMAIYASAMSVSIDSNVIDSEEYLSSYLNYFDVIYYSGVKLQIPFSKAKCDYSSAVVNNTGKTEINCEYQGYSFKVPVVVCSTPNESEENKTILYIGQYYFPTYSVGEDLDNIITNAYVEIIYSDGSSDSKSLSELNITLEEEDKPDTSHSGYKELNLTYESVSFTYAFGIVESDNGGGSEEGGLMFVMTGTDNKSVYAYNDTPIVGVAVYDNDTADIYIAKNAAESYDGDPNPEDYEVIRVDYTINQEDYSLTLLSGGVAGAILKVNYEESSETYTFSDYTFTGEPQTTYSGTNSEGNSFTLKVYENGMSEMILDENTYNVGVASVEYTEDTTTSNYINIVGVQYFELTGDENNTLSTVTVDSQTTPSSGTSVGEYYGLWAVVSAYVEDSDGTIVPETGWGSASLYFKADGKVTLFEYTGQSFYCTTTTWTFNSDSNSVTIAIPDASADSGRTATVTISNGVMIYQYQDTAVSWKGVCELRR